MADKGAPVLTIVEETPGEVLRAFRESKHMLRPDFASWTADAQRKEWGVNLVRDLEDNRIAFTKRHYDDINRSWWGEDASEEDVIWRERLRRAILRQKVAAGTEIKGETQPLTGDKEQVTVTLTKRKGRQIVVTILIPTVIMAFLGWKYAVQEWMLLNFSWGLGGGGVYDFNDFMRLLKTWIVVVVVGLLLSWPLRVIRWPKFAHETENSWLTSIVGNLGFTFALYVLVFQVLWVLSNINDTTGMYPLINPKGHFPLLISVAFGLLCYGFSYLLSWSNRRSANLTGGQTSLK